GPLRAFVREWAGALGPPRGPRWSRVRSPDHCLRVPGSAQDLAHPEPFVLERLERLQRFLLRVDRRSVLPLIFEDGSHAVRLDGRTLLVARIAPELESAQVVLQRLIVLTLVSGRLGEVVQRVGDVPRVLRLLPDLERPLEVRLGVVVLRLEEIDVADVVEAVPLDVVIADVALNLERLLVELKSLVVVTAVLVEAAQGN